jgi:hypothetical protein
LKKYLLIYYGGNEESDPKKAEAIMGDWMKWFKDLGAAVVDMGAPTEPGKTVDSKGAKKGVTGDPVTGYSIIQAETLDKAVAAAKKSPHIADGGHIAVYELLPMGM